MVITPSESSSVVRSQDIVSIAWSMQNEKVSRSKLEASANLRDGVSHSLFHVPFESLLEEGSHDDLPFPRFLALPYRRQQARMILCIRISLVSRQQFYLSDARSNMGTMASTRDELVPYGQSQREYVARRTLLSPKTNKSVSSSAIGRSMKQNVGATIKVSACSTLASHPTFQSLHAWHVCFINGI